MSRVQPILRWAWRAARAVATRVWYDRPGELMVAYLILAAAAVAVARSADMQFKPIDYGSILMLAFLCWRVFSGSRSIAGIRRWRSGREALRP